jgi:putative transposase
MSRTGNCYDNAVTESFFGTLKGECVDRVSFQTRGHARQVIFEYVECFYNSSWSLFGHALILQP